MSKHRGIASILALFVIALAAAALTACGEGNSSAAERFGEETDSGLVAFGAEGSDGEREQATETVSEFLAARSAGDWKTACEQIASSMVDKLEHLATTSTSLDDKSCASFLAAFVQLSSEELSEKEVGEAALRRSGKKGFLIYFGADEVVRAMPLEMDDDEWKVAAVSAKQLS
ncbi:MAG TPA: hypothetical protein VG898_08965 [Solirubrobacterales bacterium]|nr:hypothetical protein [Solirubrobacterales bacterium]